jgi:hypothetical protein
MLWSTISLRKEKTVIQIQLRLNFIFCFSPLNSDRKARFGGFLKICSVEVKEIDLLLTKAYLSFVCQRRERSIFSLQKLTCPMCVKEEIHAHEEPLQEREINLLLELISLRVLCVWQKKKSTQLMSLLRRGRSIFSLR